MFSELIQLLSIRSQKYPELSRRHKLFRSLCRNIKLSRNNLLRNILNSTTFYCFNIKSRTCAYKNKYKGKFHCTVINITSMLIVRVSLNWCNNIVACHCKSNLSHYWQIIVSTYFHYKLNFCTAFNRSLFIQQFSQFESKQIGFINQNTV